MKIWLLTTEFPPFYGGGISTYCSQTVKMFAEKNNQITVITCHNDLTAKQIVEIKDNIRIVRFKPGLKTIYKEKKFIEALSYDFADRVEDLLKNDIEPPDIIECHDYLGISFALLQRKQEKTRLTNIPIAITLHSPKFICDKFIPQLTPYAMNNDIEKIERLSISLCDLILSPSKYLANILPTMIDFTDKNIHIVPNPYKISPLKFGFVRNQMIYLGRIQYLKGIENLLENLKPFWDAGTNLKLDVIGGDTMIPSTNRSFKISLENKYKKYIEEGLLEFKGLLPPADVQKSLSYAHAIFIPSLYENFPYSVIESMALGKIVFASNNGGQREIIQDGENGYLFSHADSDTFTSRLNKILNMTDEEVFLMGEKARARIEELCSYDKVYSLKMKVWQNYIERKRSDLNEFHPV